MSGNGQKIPFSERVRRFLEGRNGNDELSRFLTLAALVLLIISLVTGKVWDGILSSVLWWIALAMMIFGYFRTFSKNIYKRQAENDKYVAIKRKLFGDPATRRAKNAERKAYRHFRCPECKTEMRVPRGKGKVKITCKMCGHVFFGKT